MVQFHRLCGQLPTFRVDLQEGCAEWRHCRPPPPAGVITQMGLRVPLDLRRLHPLHAIDVAPDLGKAQAGPAGVGRVGPPQIR